MALNLGCRVQDQTEKVVAEPIQGRAQSVEPKELAQKNKGRWTLALLFLFFAVPLVAVMLMHYFEWHPKGSSRGELISPAVALKIPEGLMDSQSQQVTGAVWNDKWSMVFVTDDCAEICLERLHDMRQLHVSFAKDIDRVQRVLISSSPNSDALNKQYPDLVIINQPDVKLTELTAEFNIAGANASTENRIYLVDPLGNLMMSYPLNIPVAEIRKDMARLLRYSWAG